MTADDSANSTEKPRRPIGWKVLKWALFAAVMVFVIRRGYQLVQSEDVFNVRLHPSWMVLSGMAYLAGWLPAIWFWHCLMRHMGYQISPKDTSCAYFCGHLGKYIPGKASVLIIRGMMMKERGVGMGLATLTAGYETLATMGAGAAVALAMLPWVCSDEQLTRWIPDSLSIIRMRPDLVALGVLLLCLISLPLISRLLTRIALKMVPKTPDDSTLAQSADPQASMKIGVLFLYQGIILLILGWWLHGLSLGLAIRSVSDDPLRWADWPLWTAAVSLSTVLGFVAVFAPGGLGVREGLLFEVLSGQSQIGAQTAVAASVTMRLTWIGAEIFIVCLLYYGFWRRRNNSSPQLTK